MWKTQNNKIKDGTLQIRKTEDPCHAKMYLFEYRDDINEGGEEPGTVITGSSNLSYQGLEGRLEINARFTDKGMYNEGKEIFNELWDKSVEIIGSDTIPDFEEKVIKHIWYEKLYSPYLIYIRVLNEYLTIPDKNNILTPFDITDGRFLNLKYQLDAVKVTLNNLENHNGAIVSDVVGLGKSIIGSTVARNLKLRTIVIAPPHLCKGWDEYRDEFGFQGTVFSGGKIEAALSHYENIRKDGEQFLIIVDEAHRYRNEETKDYALLHNLCMGNKVMLLTATPFNNEPADIYSLLKLFQIPSRSTLKTVENLGASFRYLMSEYADMRKKMREGKMSPQEVESVKEKVASGIRAIINPLVIRRSRLDLQEIDAYKEDLKQQKIKLVIPNDPQELEYELGSLQSLYLETLEQISPRDTEPSSSVKYFKSARYSPVNYVIPEMREALSNELEKQTGVEFNMLMGRQMNIAKFMRRLLVSRFESSVAAFKSSLGYMIQSSEHLVKWFESVGSIPVFKKGNLPDVSPR